MARTLVDIVFESVEMYLSESAEELVSARDVVSGAADVSALSTKDVLNMSIEIRRALQHTKRRIEQLKMVGDFVSDLLADDMGFIGSAAEPATMLQDGALSLGSTTQLAVGGLIFVDETAGMASTESGMMGDEAVDALPLLEDATFDIDWPDLDFDIEAAVDDVGELLDGLLG